jgi:excisionase family DNA binding protein
MAADRRSRIVALVAELVDLLVAEPDVAPAPAERLRLADAARVAGTTVRVLRAAIARGELPAVKAGRGYTLAPADLDGWLASHAVQPRQPATRAASPAERALAQARRSGSLRSIAGGAR